MFTPLCERMARLSPHLLAPPPHKEAGGCGLGLPVVDKCLKRRSSHFVVHLQPIVNCLPISCITEHALPVCFFSPFFNFLLPTHFIWFEFELPFPPPSSLCRASSKLAFEASCEAEARRKQKVSFLRSTCASLRPPPPPPVVKV